MQQNSQLLKKNNHNETFIYEVHLVGCISKYTMCYGIQLMLARSIGAHIFSIPGIFACVLQKDGKEAYPSRKGTLVYFPKPGTFTSIDK